jgi:putative flippase GtrA
MYCTVVFLDYLIYTFGRYKKQKTNMYLIHRKYQKEARRFSAYMVSGGAQFWSGYAAFALFDLVFGIPFWPAKITAYFIGASVNFGLERFWVFRSKKHVSRKQIEVSARKYYLLMFSNFVIDQAIVGGLREVGISPYIGQFVSAGFFTFWNYALFKFWVFRDQKAKRAK